MTNEGTRRMILLGKRIMLFGSLAGIALWVLSLFLHPTNTSGFGLVELFMLVAAPVSCGAILWVIAWIMEGFMTSSDHK
jgi:hypothetical protein